MEGKRVRFKDSESEPNHPENFRVGVFTAASEAREDPPMQPAASNEPKTSEFSFFKKLKQDVGRNSCQKSLNRESIPMRDIRPTNPSTDSVKSKKDVRSSQYAKKSTTGESGSFLNPPKRVALQSSDTWDYDSTAMPSKEHDGERFKCLPLVKTPPSCSLDLFLSKTANASVNPENQQKDGDIFSSKRLKIQQRIAKTLFPDANEVPKECNLVSLLLSRLLPECSQENPSQNLPLRQPETKEKCQLRLESDIQLEEALNTRKLVKINSDHFVDRDVSVDQSPRFWESLPSGQIIAGSDASEARRSDYSDRMLLGLKNESEQGTSLNDIAYGHGSERFGGRNILTWGNELFDYSTLSKTSPKNFKNEAFKQFSNYAFDSDWSCRYKDHTHSYEVLTDYFGDAKSISHVYGDAKSISHVYGDAKSISHVYGDAIQDLNLDRGPQSSLNSWCDFSSRVSLEGFSQTAFSNCRDFETRKEFFPRLVGWKTELNVHDSTQISQLNYLNDFERRREFCPRLIGLNPYELNVHDSAQTTGMEIELYHPPSFTSSKDLQDSPLKLDISSQPSSAWNEDPCVSPEKRNLLQLSPYNRQNHDIQALNLQQNNLVPSSPYIPFKISYGPEELNPDYPGFSISRGSNFFYIPQNGYQSLENMMCGRNDPTVELLPYLPRLESDTELKCKSMTGFLTEQYDKHTDNVLELFKPGYSSSQFLIANEDNLAILQPEHHHSMTSVHVPIGREDFHPLQLQTLKWKDSAYYDDDRRTSSPCGSLF